MPLVISKFQLKKWNHHFCKFVDFAYNTLWEFELTKKLISKF